MFSLTLGSRHASFRSRSRCHSHFHLACSHFAPSRMPRRSSRAVRARLGIPPRVYPLERRRSGDRPPHPSRAHRLSPWAPRRHYPAQPPPRAATPAPLPDARPTRASSGPGTASGARADSARSARSASPAGGCRWTGAWGRDSVGWMARMLGARAGVAGPAKRGDRASGGGWGVVEPREGMDSPGVACLEPYSVGRCAWRVLAALAGRVRWDGLAGVRRGRCAVGRLGGSRRWVLGGWRSCWRVRVRYRCIVPLF